MTMELQALADEIAAEPTVILDRDQLVLACRRAAARFVQPVPSLAQQARLAAEQPQEQAAPENAGLPLSDARRILRALRAREAMWNMEAGENGTDDEDRNNVVAFDVVDAHITRLEAQLAERTRERDAAQARAAVHESLLRGVRAIAYDTGDHYAIWQAIDAHLAGGGK